jgi:hypothetical protein
VLKSRSDGLINQPTLWRIVLLEKLTVAQLDQKFKRFMEPEGPLPCTQEPATTAGAEPDESSPLPQIIFL